MWNNNMMSSGEDQRHKWLKSKIPQELEYLLIAIHHANMFILWRSQIATRECDNFPLWATVGDFTCLYDLWGFLVLSAIE